MPAARTTAPRSSSARGPTPRGATARTANSRPLPLLRAPPAGRVALREVLACDIGLFFEQQRDPRACEMAAFGAGRPDDRAGFAAHWQRLLADAAIVKKAVLFDGDLAGHVLAFEQLGQREVSYWIGRDYWGRRIATRALALFLESTPERPLHARVAKDNAASLRVLENNGFEVCAQDRGYAAARGAEVEEWILRLGPPEAGA